MQRADFFAAAGVDPYQRAGDVLDARPGEVIALGEAFTAAAGVLTTSGGLSTLAGQLADASAVFDGAAPTDLMAELTSVRQALQISPTQLGDIGGRLCGLGAALSLAQQQVGDVLAGMEEECAAVLAQHAALDYVIVGQEALTASALATGASIVSDAHACVAGVIDQYDAHLGEVLIALQQAGYVLPADVDAALPAVDVGGPAEIVALSLGPAFATRSPAEIAQWWAGLSATEQALLIQHLPQQIAALQGLPSAVYHLVNLREVVDDDIRVTESVEAVAQQLFARPEFIGPIKSQLGVSSPSDLLTLSGEGLLQLTVLLPTATTLVLELIRLRVQVDSVDDLRGSLQTGNDGKERYLLEYDFDDFGGDGAAVIAIGDIETADNVAVVVQGATHDLSSIGKQSADAEVVLTEMDALGGEQNAVIVYEGYDNPTAAQSPMPGRARDGGQLLADDLAGYAAAQHQATGGDAHTTVIGHSYGTTVTSYAMQVGGSEYVDDVVLYGSPGLLAGRVEQLGLDAEHVYIGMSPKDVLVGLSVFDYFVPGTVLGPDPILHGFGGTVIGVDGVDSHGDYFGYEGGKPNEALHNAAAIAAGKPYLVTK